MRYLLCLIPPLAVLSCGKPVQFFLNLFLTLLLYVPGVIHAILVVSQFNADRRTDRIVNAMTPASGPPSLPASATQGRSMKFTLLAGAFACAFVFAILAAMVAGLRSRTPPQAEKPVAALEEADFESAPSAVTGKKKKKGKGGKKAEANEATTDKLPAYTIIDDKTKPSGEWRIVEVRLQEKASEDGLKIISEEIQSARPNMSKCTIFYRLPEQIVGDAWAKPGFDPSLKNEKTILGAAWAKADFDPTLKTEIMGNPIGVKPPKSDGAIVGQWEYAMGMFLTLSRTKDGLKMISTGAKDNSPISDELVNATVDGSRVIIRPMKANDRSEYWILDDAKNLLLADATGTFGKAAAIIKPTLKP